jgi:hypothetical protein
LVPVIPPPTASHSVCRRLDLHQAWQAFLDTKVASNPRTPSGPSASED